MPVLDMKPYHAKRKQKIADRIKKIQIEKGIKEVVLRIITDDQFPECQSYLKSKVTHGTDCGIKVEVIKVATIEQLKFWITDSIANNIPMIFQLPSRKEFEEYYMKIMKHHKELDMDGFFNLSEVCDGDYTFAPCTPKGILNYIKSEDGLNLDLRGKNIVVVGSRGKLVGKPFIIMATNEGATVTGLNSVSDKTMKFSALKQADIVILASGVKGTVCEYDLSNNKIVYVLNVGIVFDENGKLDTELEVNGTTNVFYSNKIGAIGISTVVNLLDNVCNYYELIR
ncbi:MAG: hypothetical protein ACRDDY_03765 [Clostridium sp.]|uniref:hypothetical protein n=1 Tax=Clostridium sp. TaxID=1506 RepID=UPI003EE52D02